MKPNSKTCDCEGCRIELLECYAYQRAGADAGIEFWKGHCFFYAIDPKTRKFIVPIYDMRKRNEKEKL